VFDKVQANIVKNMGDLSNATGAMALVPQKLRDALDPFAEQLTGAANKTLDTIQAKANKAAAKTPA
jgi:hypothetical protein